MTINNLLTENEILPLIKDSLIVSIHKEKKLGRLVREEEGKYSFLCLGEETDSLNANETVNFYTFIYSKEKYESTKGRHDLGSDFMAGFISKKGDGLIINSNDWTSVNYKTIFEKEKYRKSKDLLREVGIK